MKKLGKNFEITNQQYADLLTILHSNDAPRIRGTKFLSDLSDTGKTYIHHEYGCKMSLRLLTLSEAVNIVDKLRLKLKLNETYKH